MLRISLSILFLALTVSFQTPQTSPAPSKNFVPLVNAEGQSWTERYIDVPVIGQVNAYVPKAPTTDVVLFLSGDDGWLLGVVDMARRIATHRVMVVGLNFVTLRRGQGDVACWDTSAQLETVGRAAEKALGLATYHPPTLVGYSSGATMVYAGLAQGAAGAFAAGMSLGFCPDLPTAKPACPVGDWQPTHDPVKPIAWLPTTPDIKRDWYLLHGVQDTECPPAETEKFVSTMAHAHYVPIEGTGHGFGRPERWTPAFDATVEKLFPKTRKR
jgi:predicted esterase